MNPLFKVICTVAIVCFSNYIKSSNIHELLSDKEDGEIVAMFLSDFHIGENYGGVTRKVPKNKEHDYDSLVSFPGLYYHKQVTNLLACLDRETRNSERKTIPYLILLGDIFDIAVSESSDVFNMATAFFNAQIYQGRSFISFFDTIIYVAGNHDHHVWVMLQEKLYVIDRLQNGSQAIPFPHQTIGLLDVSDQPHYRDISNTLFASKREISFLSYVFSNNKKTVFVCYPNLYIRYNGENKNEGICVTHGHFFEPNWNKDTSLISFFPDVNSMSDYFVQLEKLNSPFTEFVNYLIAQAFPVFTHGLVDATFGGLPLDSVEILEKMGIFLAQSFPALFPLETFTNPQTNVEKLKNHNLQVFSYLYHSFLQMRVNNMELKKLVYGHTHIPSLHQTCSFEDFSHSHTFSDLDWIKNRFEIYNTGGWVNIEYINPSEFDNSTNISPNPMFLHRDGRISKVFTEE